VTFPLATPWPRRWRRRARSRWAAAYGLPELMACRVEAWRWNAGLGAADVREQVLVGLLADGRRDGAAAA